MCCYTKYCIYGNKCANCTKTYVGETANLSLIHNLQKQHIREDKPFEVILHINDCGGGQLKIMSICKMKNDQKVDRKNKKI